MAAQPVADRFQAEALAVIQTDLLAVAKRFQRTAFLLGVERAMSELGIEGVDIFDPRAQAFASEFEYRSIRSLTARTSVLVRDALQDGIRRGLGVDDIAANLDNVLQGRVATVDTIARTETNRAANWGRLNGWKKSGLVQQKESIATLDDRVRPDHLEANGEVAQIDSTFTRGAAAGLLAPPYAPNCRCTIAPVTRLTGIGRDATEVEADAEAGRAWADEMGFKRPADPIPGVIQHEDEHAAALRAAWARAGERWKAMLRDANR